MKQKILISVTEEDGKEIKLGKIDKLRLISFDEAWGSVEAVKKLATPSEGYTKYTPRGFLRINVLDGDNNSFNYCIHPNGMVLDENLDRVNYVKGEDGYIYFEVNEDRINLIRTLIEHFNYSVEALSAFKRENTMAGLQYVVDEDRIGTIFHVSPEHTREYDIVLIDNIVTVYLPETDVKEMKDI